MSSGGASEVPAIFASWLVGSGKMTLTEGIITGVIVLFIGWFGKQCWKYLPKIIETSDRKRRIIIFIVMCILLGGLAFGIIRYNQGHVPVHIINIVRLPYEVGKEARINLYYGNNQNALRVHHVFAVVLFTNAAGKINRRQTEEELWAMAAVKWKSDKTPLAEWSQAPVSEQIYTTLLGPILTKEHVARLQSGAADLYYVGAIKFSDKDGYAGAIEYCGFFEENPEPNFLCREHNGLVEN